MPLTDRMVQIVEELRQAEPEGKFIFGGNRPIGEGRARDLLTKLLKSIGHNAHCRAARLPRGAKGLGARDARLSERGRRAGAWTSHQSRPSSAPIGAAILFDRRKILMADWENHCCGGGEFAARLLSCAPENDRIVETIIFAPHPCVRCLAMSYTVHACPLMSAVRKFAELRARLYHLPQLSKRTRGRCK